MASDFKVVRGSTVEEQIKSIDAALASRNKITKNQKVAVAPTVIPISCSVVGPAAGQVMISFLFPIAGDITKAFSRMSGARKVNVSVTLESEKTQKSINLDIGDGSRDEVVSLSVKAGDVLTATFNSASARPGEAGEPVNLIFSLLFSAALSKKGAIKIAQDEVGV